MKKALKIIIAIIVVVALVIGGIFAYKFISTNMAIKTTEEKLSQINAEELKEKLIKELESTKLNVNTSSLKTTFETYDLNDKSEMGNLILMWSKYYAPSEDFFNGFVFANISNNNLGNDKSFLFPCFKIESDIDGKVKNIQYTFRDNYWIANDIIVKSIDKVLKEQYGINSLIGISYSRDKDNYTNHYKESVFYSSTDTDFATSVISEITQNTDKSYMEKKLQEKKATNIEIFIWNIE